MDNVSNYSFNGSEALAESREDYRFYERFVDVNGNKIYEPVEVTDVCVMIYKIEKPDITYASDSYYLTAKCFSEICGDYTLRYCIAKKQYLDFINDKNGNYRLELLLQYSKGDLFVRKVRARVHIDVRMRNELYKQICDDAERCKMTPSAYLRELSKGKRPRAALTEDEFVIMKDFVKIYHHYDNFFNAVKGYMKGMTSEQKLNLLIEGLAWKNFRLFIIEGLPVMKRLVDGSRMRQNNTWHDAQGEKLPKIGREVIVFIQSSDKSLKVDIAYRLNPKLQNVFGIGKWNKPYVKYWLDVELPKGDNERGE